MEKKYKRRTDAEAAVDNLITTIKGQAEKQGISLSSSLSLTLISSAKQALMKDLEEHYELYDC